MGWEKQALRLCQNSVTLCETPFHPIYQILNEFVLPTKKRKPLTFSLTGSLKNLKRCDIGLSLTKSSDYWSDDRDLQILLPGYGSKWQRITAAALAKKREIYRTYMEQATTQNFFTWWWNQKKKSSQIACMNLVKPTETKLLKISLKLGDRFHS